MAGGTRSLFVSRAPPRLATPRATSKRDRPTDAHLYSLPSPAGVPWTEDEHRLFLLGLQKLGKVRRGKIESHRQARGSSPRASARARDPERATSAPPTIARSSRATIRLPARPRGVPAAAPGLGNRRPTRGTFGRLWASRSAPAMSFPSSPVPNQQPPDTRGDLTETTAFFTQKTDRRSPCSRR